MTTTKPIDPGRQAYLRSLMRKMTDYVYCRETDRYWDMHTAEMHTAKEVNWRIPESEWPPKDSYHKRPSGFIAQAGSPGMQQVDSSVCLDGYGGILLWDIHFSESRGIQDAPGRVALNTWNGK